MKEIETFRMLGFKTEDDEAAEALIDTIREQGGYIVNIGEDDISGIAQRIRAELKCSKCALSMTCILPFKKAAIAFAAREEHKKRNPGEDIDQFTFGFTRPKDCIGGFQAREAYWS